MRVGLQRSEGGYFYWHEIPLFRLIRALFERPERPEDWNPGYAWSPPNNTGAPFFGGFGPSVAIQFPYRVVYDYRLKELGYWPWRRTNMPPVWPVRDELRGIRTIIE